MTEALKLTPAQVILGVAALNRMTTSSTARREGPDMSKPTATAADFRKLRSI